MGNCLATEEKLIKVMKSDGKVLEYRAPTKAYQVLSDFAGHAVSDVNTNSAVRHLKPDANLVPGQFYYLLPLAEPPQPQPVKVAPAKKKRVTFAIPEKESNGEEGSTGGGSEVVMRIKLLITKKELEALLSKEGVSVGDLVTYQVPQGKEKIVDQKDHDKSDLTAAAADDDDGNSRSWKPVLESISEN